VGFFVQVVKRATVPQATVNAKVFRVAVQRDGVGAIGLQFDCVGPGLFGGFDDLEGGFDAAVVVGDISAMT